MLKLRHRLPLVIAVVLAFAGIASGGPLQEDLKARRARAMDTLGPDAVAVFWSAPPRVYSNDVNYEYRQESNLLYLTGIDQEDTTLVLMPGNRAKREILFIREADPRREHWQGHTLTPTEAAAASGIETVFTANLFEPFMAGVLSGQRTPGLSHPDEAKSFFDALGQGRASLALLLEPQRNLSDDPGPARQFAAKMRDRFPGLQVKDATPVLAELRQIKTPYEQAVLRQSVVISTEAHKAGMRAAAPGKWEYQVEAAIEQG
jgi:Xaa-Pro aminopeptidase